MPFTVDLPLPSPNMIQLANKLLGTISDLSFQFRMYGLLEDNLESYGITENTPNKDLILAYFNKQLDITTAIYLAMERARVAV